MNAVQIQQIKFCQSQIKKLMDEIGDELDEVAKKIADEELADRTPSDDELQKEDIMACVMENLDTSLEYIDAALTNIEEAGLA